MSPLLGADANAAVTVTTVRTEVLYAPTGSPDCSALSKIQDDTKLPLYVVRLTATAEGVAPDQVRFQWSPPRPAVGMLAADLDLGPTDQTTAIQGLCAEFGSKCTLTPDQLPFYNKNTILWIAPTCAILPKSTRKPYNGGVVRIGVKAFTGRHGLGKGSVKLGFGHLASVTLFANGMNGLGKSAVNTPLNVVFGATVDTKGATLPAIDDFKFDNGGGASATVTRGCPGASYDACALLLYHAGGNFLATVAVDLHDKSELCDNLTDHVGTVDNIGKLIVTTTPHKGSYASGDSVNLRVAFKNVSPNPSGTRKDVILLQGPGFLSCAEAVKIGATTSSKATTFDTQHCSQTSGQPCQADFDCQRPFCSTCVDNEVCLTQSHCSTTQTQPCTHDTDCAKAVCTTCADSETCIQVLATPSIDVAIGQSVELINKPIPLGNAFPDTAKIKDTWTVNPFNAAPDSVGLKYRIRGKPAAR